MPARLCAAEWRSEGSSRAPAPAPALAVRRPLFGVDSLSINLIKMKSKNIKRVEGGGKGKIKSKREAAATCYVPGNNTVSGHRRSAASDWEIL